MLIQAAAAVHTAARDVRVRRRTLHLAERLCVRRVRAAVGDVVQGNRAGRSRRTQRARGTHGTGRAVGTCGTCRACCADGTCRSLRASSAFQSGSRPRGQIDLLKRAVDDLRGSDAVLRKLGDGVARASQRDEQRDERNDRGRRRPTVCYAMHGTPL